MSIKMNVSRDSDGEIQANEPTAAPVARESDQQPAGVGFKSQVRGQKLTVNINSGQVTESMTQRSSINTADMIAENAAANPGSVAATVQSPLGRPLVNRPVADNDLVTVNGMQMQVGQAISLGILAVDPTTNGIVDNFSEEEALEYANRNNQQEPEELAEVLSEETVNMMRYSTRHFTEAQGTQYILSALEGNLDAAAIQRDVETKGRNVEEIAATFTQAVNGIVQDLSEAIGLDFDDPEETADTFGDFLGVLKDYDNREYAHAMRYAVQIGDYRPLVALIDKVHNRTGLLDEMTPAEAGMVTKVENGTELVQIEDNGQKMFVTASVARKLGYI